MQKNQVQAAATGSKAAPIPWAPSRRSLPMCWWLLPFGLDDCLMVDHHFHEELREGWLIGRGAWRVALKMCGAVWSSTVHKCRICTQLARKSIKMAVWGRSTWMLSWAHSSGSSAFCPYSVLFGYPAASWVLRLLWPGRWLCCLPVLVNLQMQWLRCWALWQGSRNESKAVQNSWTLLEQTGNFPLPLDVPLWLFFWTSVLCTGQVISALLDGRKVLWRLRASSLHWDVIQAVTTTIT